MSPTAASALPATPLALDGLLATYAPLVLLAAVLLLALVKASVVLALLRQALAGIPPAPLAALLSILLSAFAMAPLAERVHAAMSTTAKAPIPGRPAVEPEQQLEAGLRPLREFLTRHTPQRELLAVADLSARMRPQTAQTPGTPPSLPALALAFVLSELRSAFLVGFVLLLPFVLIDLLVGTLLAGLALSGLSVRMVALPCKLLLFVACDGWQLLVRGLLLAYGSPDATPSGATP